MKKLGVILVVALLCCGFIPQHKAVRQTTDNRSTTELYADAIKCLSIHNDTVGAIQNLTSLFAKDSTNAAAVHLYSRIAKDKKEAVVFAEMAYKLDSTNHFYLEHYANELYDNDELEKALPLFKKMVEKSTNPSDFHHLAVIYFHHFKDVDAALRVLNDAFMRFGKIPGFVNFRQFMLVNTGRAKEAEEEVKKAIEEAPHIVDNYLLLADLYKNTKRDSLAVVTYQRALGVDSTSINVWVDFGNFSRRRNDYRTYLFALNKIMQSNDVPVEAKLGEWSNLTSWEEGYKVFYAYYNEIINTIYALHPDHVDVKRSYATHLLATERKEEALELYKSCIDVPKPKVSDFIAVADIETYIFNRPDSAALYINRALTVYPENPRLHFLKATTLASNGELDKSLHHYNISLKHFDNDTLRSTVYEAIGNVHHLRKDMKSCYKAYDNALNLVIDNAGVLNNYAYFLSLDGKKLKLAKAMANRANELSKDNPTYLDTKAWVLYKLGEYAEAKKVMQRALALTRSKGYEYPLHYGHILYALGEEFIAKTYWRRALEACTNQEEADEVQASINKVVRKKKKK